MTDTMVIQGRSGLSQITTSPRPSEVAGNLIASLLHPEARKRDPSVVDNAMGLLSFLQFLENTRRKAAFAYNGLQQTVLEVAKNPAVFDVDAVKNVQMSKDALSDLVDVIARFQEATIQVPRAAPGESQFPYQALALFAFDLVSATWPTTFAFIQDELKKQIPEKLGIRLVIERWKGPAPSMSSAQEFVVDEYPVPQGMGETDVVVVSEGARTSIAEDAELLKATSGEMEAAFRVAGASVGQIPIVVIGAKRAVPWLIRMLGSWIGTKGVAKAAEVGLIRYFFGKVTVKGITSAVWWGSLAAITVTATATIIPKVPVIVGGVAEGANRAVGAALKGIEPLVIVALIAAGVAALGGAIALVTRA